MTPSKVQPVRTSAPVPDLRIVPVESVHAHETHDNQRSGPLIDTLRTAPVMINPPVVAPLEHDQYVILDGANRCHTFRHLGYPHILVQVATYESGYVELSTWQHVLSNWAITDLIEQLHRLESVELHYGLDSHGIVHFVLRDGQLLALRAPVETTHERNLALQQVVGLYQRHARLERTAITEPEDIWPLFPTASAVVIFPRYEPKDILAAARYQAFLPPGVSRHIVHGRALRVNYPMDTLRNRAASLESKNEALRHWLLEKIAQRQLRYYAEATYQFDE